MTDPCFIKVDGTGSVRAGQSNCLTIRIQIEVIVNRRHSISQQLPGTIRHPVNDREPWKYIDLRYLAAMADVPAIINIAISLKIQPNDGPVFYKVDGTRFGQSRTIKLLTGSKYKIEVIVKPGSAEAA
ncbi:hypothetical protein cypCar_00025149 [Cyprinus carpio]|nr:hypothetical protein cypCar_00025149 [Cyprinus carpio]